MTPEQWDKLTPFQREVLSILERLLKEVQRYDD
jgi:hypothetical protein